MRLSERVHPTRAITTFDPLLTIGLLGLMTWLIVSFGSTPSSGPNPGSSSAAVPSPSVTVSSSPESVATPRALPTAASRGRMTAPAKSPRPRHAPSVAGSSSFQAWRTSREAIGVANCESGPGPRHPKFDVYVGDIHEHYGSYDGKWQDGPREWRDYGGLKYASRPSLATELEQDIVNYALYRARGWQPWACRSVL